MGQVEPAADSTEKVDVRHPQVRVQQDDSVSAVGQGAGQGERQIALAHAPLAAEDRDRPGPVPAVPTKDRKSTRLNSSHQLIS